MFDISSKQIFIDLRKQDPCLFLLFWIAIWSFFFFFFYLCSVHNLNYHLLKRRYALFLSLHLNKIYQENWSILIFAVVILQFCL